MDIDATEVGRNRPVDVGLVADSRSALAAFADGAKKATRTAYIQELRASETRKLEALEEWTRSDAVPIHHYRLARELSTVANAGDRDPMFIADGGNWVALAAKVLTLKAPGRWLDPGPLGCLGVGAPFALAAKLLHPERQIWVVQGDGSFGLNGFDFETAVRFKLPMICVVGNDAAWGQSACPSWGCSGRSLRRRCSRRRGTTRWSRPSAGRESWSPSRRRSGPRWSARSPRVPWPAST